MLGYLDRNLCDGNLQRRRSDAPVRPCIERQGDASIAFGGVFRDLDQALEYVASASRFEFKACPEWLLLDHRKGDFGHGMDIGRNRVGVIHEGPSPRTDAWRSDADREVASATDHERGPFVANRQCESPVEMHDRRIL